MCECVADWIHHERERIAIGRQKQTAILANVRKVRGALIKARVKEVGRAKIAARWIHFRTEIIAA